MRYFLKLATTDGNWEEITKYTFDNSRLAVADDEVSPRYTMNDFVIVNDDDTVSMQLTGCSLKDIYIFQRYLKATAAEVPGGFVREPVVMKFLKRGKLEMPHPRRHA